MLGFACAGFRRLRLVLWLFPSCVWDVLWYRILVKKGLFLEQNRHFPKRRWVRSRNGFLSSGGLVASVVNKKMFWELPQISLFGTIRVFCSNAESRFGCARLRRLRSVFWLFTSSVWDVLRSRKLRKKQLLIFSETSSSSFWIVCNCFDDFPTNRPKNIGRSHRKENTNFPKRRGVLSKFVCLNSAFVFSLVVTRKYVLRTSWGLSTWNNTCFLFKCRVTFWLRYLSNATFGTLALYILRLRCFAIQNTLKKKTAFDFYGNVVFVVLDCVHFFEGFCTNLWKMSANVTKTD